MWISEEANIQIWIPGSSKGQLWRWEHGNMKNVMKLLEFKQWHSQKNHRRLLQEFQEKKKKWVQFKTNKRAECEYTVRLAWPLPPQPRISHDLLQASSYTKQQDKVTHKIQNFHDLLEKRKCNSRKNTVKHYVKY